MPVSGKETISESLIAHSGGARRPVRFCWCWCLVSEKTGFPVFSAFGLPGSGLPLGRLPDLGILFNLLIFCPQKGGEVNNGRIANHASYTGIIKSFRLYKLFNSELRQLNFFKPAIHHTLKIPNELICIV